MAESAMTASDVALLQGHDNIMDGSGAFFWIFALLILAGGGGFGNWGGGAPRGDYVTQADLSTQLNQQTMTNQLHSLGIETANNNYETARLISEQTNAMLQQNNTNLVNAIQGFNTVNQNLLAGFNTLGQQINQLGYQMDQCCCSIKTQLLQNRLDDANAALVAANNNISNYNQSQYILSQLGKFVANAPAAAT